MSAEWIVELQPGCWISGKDRTVVEENATRFSSPQAAARAFVLLAETRDWPALRIARRNDDENPAPGRCVYCSREVSRRREYERLLKEKDAAAYTLHFTTEELQRLYGMSCDRGGRVEVGYIPGADRWVTRFGE